MNKITEKRLANLLQNKDQILADVWLDEYKFVQDLIEVENISDEIAEMDSSGIIEFFVMPKKLKTLCWILPWVIKFQRGETRVVISPKETSNVYDVSIMGNKINRHVMNIHQIKNLLEVPKWAGEK